MLEPNKEYDRRRHEANRTIVRCLSEAVENNPSMRFGQILESLNIVEVKEHLSVHGAYFHAWARDVHEEPWVILDRMRKG